MYIGFLSSLLRMEVAPYCPTICSTTTEQQLPPGMMSLALRPTHLLPRSSCLASLNLELSTDSA